MAKRVPPFLTPPAIVSIVIALGAVNVVTNATTHTSEGAPDAKYSSSYSSSSSSVSMSSDSKPKKSSSSDSSSNSDQ
ncbi:hypothetical protein X281_08910, partial [Oenococcus oeni IOEB_0607]